MTNTTTTTSNQSIKFLQKTAKRGTKAAKISILTELCSKIDQVIQEQNRIPYGFVSQLVADSKSVFPWVTRDAINNHYRRLKNKQQQAAPLIPPPVNEIDLDGQGGDCPSLMSNLTDDSSNGTSISHAPPTILPTKRLKGGRAKGETEKKKQKLAEAIVAAKNEITETFLKMMKTANGKQVKRVAKGSLQSIIDDVRERRNLPPDFNMSHWTVRKRLQRGKTFASHRGHASPLLSLEQLVVTTIK